MNITKTFIRRLKALCHVCNTDIWLWSLQGGCVTKLEQFLADQLLVIGAVGIGVACLQVRHISYLGLKRKKRTIFPFFSWRSSATRRFKYDWIAPFCAGHASPASLSDLVQSYYLICLNLRWIQAFRADGGLLLFYNCELIYDPFRETWDQTNLHWIFPLIFVNHRRASVPTTEHYLARGELRINPTDILQDVFSINDEG